MGAAAQIWDQGTQGRGQTPWTREHRARAPSLLRRQRQARLGRAAQRQSRYNLRGEGFSVKILSGSFRCAAPKSALNTSSLWGLRERRLQTGASLHVLFQEHTILPSE